MKRILNRKTVIEAHYGPGRGFHVMTVYRMERSVGSQRVHVTVPVLPEELEQARCIVAYRLREARRTLERKVALAARDAGTRQGEQDGTEE